ncbi:MAG: hypothetical protein ACFFBP_07780 [Promethearchaeota archaeon]
MEGTGLPWCKSARVAPTCPNPSRDHYQQINNARRSERNGY